MLHEKTRAQKTGETIPLMDFYHVYFHLYFLSKELIGFFISYSKAVLNVTSNLNSIFHLEDDPVASCE
jgi:hypothetical protein